MGKLYVVSTPIGNLGDITKRAVECLSFVDVILCEDTRVSMKLLNSLGIKGKLVSYHKFNEVSMASKIVSDILDGKDMALISDAGTPCISDPGYVLVKEAKERGVSVIPIGGMCAFVSALSVSGLDSLRFSFCSFFPRDSKERDVLISDIKSSFIKTYAFYESPKRIVKTLYYLYDNLGNIKISVSRELTKVFETNYYGFILDVIKQIESDDKSSLGEYTFVFEKGEYESNSDDISLCAYIVDVMVKDGVSVKEAISVLVSRGFNRNKLYDASLKLKDLF